MAVQFYHNVEPNNTGPRVKWLEVLLYHHLEEKNRRRLSPVY